MTLKDLFQAKWCCDSDFTPMPRLLPAPQVTGAPMGTSPHACTHQTHAQGHWLGQGHLQFRRSCTSRNSTHSSQPTKQRDGNNFTTLDYNNDAKETATSHSLNNQSFPPSYLSFRKKNLFAIANWCGSFTAPGGNLASCLETFRKALAAK